MKRFLILVLAIFMVFAMVACKSEPEKKSGDALPVEKEAGKDALMEQGSSGAKAVDHTGFKIVVSMTEGEDSTAFEIGGKDNIYWYGFGEEGSLFFTEYSGNTYMFLDLDELGKYWIKVADKSLKEEIFTTVVDSLLYNAYDYTDVLSYVGDETKFGRSCSKYTITATEGGVSYSFSILVDKEFGITMGMEFSAGSETVKYTIEPKLSNVTADEAPEGYAAAKACTSFVDEIPIPQM